MRIIYTIPWSMSKKPLTRVAIFLTIISCSDLALAEADKTDIFVPDVRLSLAYDYKTWANPSYSGSDSLQLARDSYAGFQYRKSIGNGAELLMTFKLQNFTNADLGGVNNTREAWFGYSSSERQVEVGILKNIETYLGGASDDPLVNSAANTLTAVLDQDTFVSGMGVAAEGISYLQKDFIIEGLDAIVEFSTDDSMSSSPDLKVGYRLSNDKKDTAGGKITGGDELFVLLEPSTGFKRIGGRIFIGDFTIFGMVQGGGDALGGQDKKARFGSIEYKLSDTMKLVSTAGVSSFNSSGNHTKSSSAYALIYTPIKDINITIGNKTQVNEFSGNENESYHSSVTVEYHLGSTAI